MKFNAAWNPECEDRPFFAFDFFPITDDYGRIAGCVGIAKGFFQYFGFNLFLSNFTIFFETENAGATFSISEGNEGFRDLIDLGLFKKSEAWTLLRFYQVEVWHIL